MWRRGSSWVAVAVGLLVAPSMAAGDTVFMWFGQERVEVPVLQLAASPPENPSQAQIHLNINGLGAFRYSGRAGGAPDCYWALLFAHPDASAAPVLAANQVMREAENPFFWSFVTGGAALGMFVSDSYSIGADELPAPAEFEVLLADLGIVAQVYSFSNYYYLISQARTGTAILEEIDRLHSALGEGAWSEHQPFGCPSGGGGGGGGPLGPLEIPSLSDLSLLLFAAVLAAIGVVRARTG